MARLALSKSSLLKERRQLANFERFLPSLDLKRKQLMIERGKARTAYAARRRELEELQAEVEDKLPMLANHEVELDGLVQIENVRRSEENVVGTRLPRIDEVEVAVRPYAFLGRPHWVDNLVRLLRAYLEARLQERVAEQRVKILEHAVQRITQRVNLFEKVLIPRTRENIQRIEIYLADEQRSAVVRAKIAKRKNLERAQA
ncbi:MAG: V-type ATP synthase subunit D [Acidobacteriota bacterium]|nr:V-type ATP synthase subunit D [Acidobacteriota bacterium]